jgi:purine-binding chemotaxis protein CheW
VELDKLPRVTRVPNVPYWVRGVTNLRGEILSVLDLRMLMGMERNEHLDRGRILVVRIGEDATAALVVDEVSGITRYTQELLTPAGGDVDGRIIPLLDGIFSTEELALKVLNVDKLMATPELRQLQAA